MKLAAPSEKIYWIIYLDMIRTKITKGNQGSTDCSVKWPDKNKRPYYLLERRFTDKKGLRKTLFNVSDLEIIF